MHIQCTSRIFPNLIFLMFQICFQDLLFRCPETFDVTLSDYMCLVFSVEIYVCCLNVFDLSSGWNMSLASGRFVINFDVYSIVVDSCEFTARAL